MGRIGRIVGVEEDDDGLVVKVDLGGGEIVTADLMTPPGDGSQPRIGDATSVEESSTVGGWQASGYWDPENDSPAGRGEVYRYGRDSDGNVVCSFHLKSDGTLVVSANAKVELESPEVVLNTPNCKLSDSAGKGVMRVGDLFSGSTPPLVVTTGAGAGGIVAPAPPATATASGGIPVVGKGISGSSKTKA